MHVPASKNTENFSGNTENCTLKLTNAAAVDHTDKAKQNNRRLEKLAGTVSLYIIVYQLVICSYCIILELTI